MLLHRDWDELCLPPVSLSSSVISRLSFLVRLGCCDLDSDGAAASEEDGEFKSVSGWHSLVTVRCSSSAPSICGLPSPHISPACSVAPTEPRALSKRLKAIESNDPIDEGLPIRCFTRCRSSMNLEMRIAVILCDATSIDIMIIGRFLRMLLTVQRIV